MPLAKEQGDASSSVSSQIRPDFYSSIMQLIEIFWKIRILRPLWCQNRLWQKKSMSYQWLTVG